MRKSFSNVCWLVVMIGVFIGCNATDKTQEAATPSPQTNAANAAPAPEGAQLQYRAVCIQKEEHGGHEYVLSKWFDSREKADELGKYHGDFKYKGHQWRIDERVKPEPAKP